MHPSRGSRPKAVLGGLLDASTPKECKDCDNSLDSVLYRCNNVWISVDTPIRSRYTVYMTLRKKRSDRNHVLYRVTCVNTGDTYIGLTVAQGQAYLRSVKIRWQKHVSRANCESKDWAICKALRELSECTWQYEVLEVVRGRKPAHERERELIHTFNPSLNTF